MFHRAWAVAYFWPNWNPMMLEFTYRILKNGWKRYILIESLQDSSCFCPSQVGRQLHTNEVISFTYVIGTNPNRTLCFAANAHLKLGLNIEWKESHFPLYVPPGMGSCIFSAKLKSDDVGIHKCIASIKIVTVVNHNLTPKILWEHKLPDSIQF